MRLYISGAVSADVELAGEITRPADLEALRDAPLAMLDLSGLKTIAPQVRAAMDEAAARAREMGLDIQTVVLDFDFQEAIRDGVLISAAESLVEHEDALTANATGFSETYLQTLAIGERAAAPALARAYRNLAEAAAEAREQLTPYAGLILPTTPTQAEMFETAAAAGVALLTPLANVLGLPATAFPIGMHEGLPLSAQAVGWDDDTTLGLAQLLGDTFEAPESYRG